MRRIQRDLAADVNVDTKEDQRNIEASSFFLTSPESVEDKLGEAFNFVVRPSVSQPGLNNFTLCFVLPELMQIRKIKM